MLIIHLKVSLGLHGLSVGLLGVMLGVSAVFAVFSAGCSGIPVCMVFCSGA